MDTTTLTALKSVLPGRAFAPSDPEYAACAAGWNLTIAHRPVAIVQAESEADVVEAVRWANVHGVPVSTQSTGHGPFRICEDGLLIRTRGLGGIAVDPVAKTATVGAGAVWGDVIAATFPHGLSPVSGSAPHVGVVGYTLGGGFGILSREFGLAADHLKRVRLVKPDGEAVDASATENLDLFWALRGGGGAFGVVTELEFGLMEFNHLFGGSVMFDHTLAGEVLPKFAEWSASLPNEVSTAVHLMNFPPVPMIPEFLHGRSMVIVIGASTLPEEEAAAHFAPMRELPGAEFDSYSWKPYTRCAEIYQDPVDPLPVMGRGVMLSALGLDGIETFMDAVGPQPHSPNLMIQIRRLGGAIKEAASGATALDRVRQAEYLIYLIGVPMGPATPEAIVSHAEGVIEAMRPFALGRGPLNWLGEGDVSREHVRAVFSADAQARMQSVKAAVDPTNAFRFAGVGVD